MCQNMKKPVKVDASDKGSGRKAQMSAEEKATELERRLNEIWKAKGLIDENNMCRKRGSYEEPANNVVLPPGIDEEMLRERGVRYEGCSKQSNGVITQHYFTITDTNRGSILSTIGVNVMDDKDLIRALDMKLKTVA